MDRTFVRDMATDHSNRVLVSSVVDLGHNLGLTVVAEGVEDLLTVEALCVDDFLAYVTAKEPGRLPHR